MWSSSSQAGFWRRALALAIDAFAISVTITIAGLLLFAPTGGVVRTSKVSLLGQWVCAPVDVDPRELRLGPAFNVTGAAACAAQLFGFVHDRWLEVNEDTSKGPVTLSRSISLPIDSAGRVIRAFYLDYLTIPLLAVYLLLSEWLFGATLGKRIMGVRIQPRVDRMTDLRATGKRVALRFLPILPVVPVLLVAGIADPLSAASLATDYWDVIVVLCALSITIAFALLVNFAAATFNEDLPWHDRWARTEVVTDLWNATPRLFGRGSRREQIFLD